MNRYTLSLLSIILVFALISPASATILSVTIWGENGINVSRAQDNITKYGANNSVNISAWNVTKTFLVKSVNASGDIVSFNISNMTAYRVYELKVNGTAIDGYQTGANGMLNFTYAQNNSNVTYSLSPAMNINGVNATWGIKWTEYKKENINRTAAGTASFDTVFQNTNNTPRLVTISIREVGGGGTVQYTVRTGSTNPPTTLTDYVEINVDNSFRHLFYVNPGEYYAVYKVGATATVLIWQEWY